MAPYLGGGESQTRYRFLVPPAHVVEHGVHSLQAPHPPRSESEFCLKKKTIIFGIIQRLKPYFIVVARLPTHLGPSPKK